MKRFIVVGLSSQKVLGHFDTWQEANKFLVESKVNGLIFKRAH